MGRTRKSQNAQPQEETLGAEAQTEEVTQSEAPAEAATQAPVEASRGELCKVCSTAGARRYHTRTFDGPGIGHWPFDPESDAARQFEFYCSEPLMSLYIPLDIGEKFGALATPQVNGLKVGIAKAMSVQCPQSLAELIIESLNVTARIPNEAKTVNPYTGEVRSANLNQRTDKDALDA